MFAVRSRIKAAVAAALVIGGALSSFATGAPKYVFLFIGDGMSTPQRMAAEIFSKEIGRGQLHMNNLPYQANTRTSSASAIITDSAAAATAIACGVKTNNRMLGMDPDGKKIESVAEVAKRCGKKVGIATTVTISHATPAGFYAHQPHRSLNYEIGLDLVNSDFDYFCGGGLYGAFDNKKSPKYCGDIRELAREEGYTIATNRQEWEALKPGCKSWTYFADKALDFSIDADGSQPTLAEIVKKGIELLDGPEGFFFMCEGGKIDYAGHANDAATNLRDILALDDAVKVALDFQERHPQETLIITTGDHETGGMSMGFAGVGGAFRVDMLRYQKISVEKFSDWFKSLVREKKGEITFEEIEAVLTEKFGFDFNGKHGGGKIPLSKENIEALKAAFETDIGFVKKGVKDTTAHDVSRVYVFAQTAKNVLNAQAGVGWSSASHTALPTFTTAKGPGAEILVGIRHNTGLGKRLKALYEE
jgi:alkaline phosphatase